MSRSVLRSRGTVGSCLPDSTVVSFLENVAGGVLVSVHDKSTGRTDVGAHTQTLLDECATSTTVLAGVVWGNFDGWYPMECSIVVDPGNELSLSSIIDGRGEMSVLDHISNLQIFIGNQVVRRDERIRFFPSEVFTLPLNFEMCSGYLLTGFKAILGPLLFTWR
jgi:hypothetical protein